MIRLAYLPSLLILSLCLTAFVVCRSSAVAQGPSEEVKQGNETENADWYYGSEGEQVKKMSIGRQKSIRRAEQRMARLEAMRWYGFSASRPTASGMPFTSSYSPSWTRPGGRPFGWHAGGGPSVVINRPYYRSYRRY